MKSVLMGAVAMAALVTATFFLKFWRRTGDRFFLLFAVAFLVDAIDRAALGMLTDATAEYEAQIYWGRLITFGLILVAIADKNRRRHQQ